MKTAKNAPSLAFTPGKRAKGENWQGFGQFTGDLGVKTRSNGHENGLSMVTDNYAKSSYHNHEAKKHTKSEVFGW